MAENSKIEWTDHTFNPWVGCTKISPACDHCYAEAWAKRTGGSALWAGERRRTSAANWQLPLKWNRQAARDGVRRKVFCASLADVFENQVPDEWRRDLWQLIAETMHLDWLLLTKRPQNIARMLPVMDSRLPGYLPWNERWPWANVWLGTTVANQQEADRNIPHLVAVPAALRFLSIEPMLGQIDILPWLPGDSECAECDDGEGWGNRCSRSDIPRDEQCPRRFEVVDNVEGPPGAEGVPTWFRQDKRSVDWVICGGESGPGARPMHPEWAQSLRDQCSGAGVPFFFKQWGEHEPVPYEAEGFWMRRVGKRVAGALLDGREWREIPSEGV